MNKTKITVVAIALLIVGSLFAQEKRTIKVIVPNKTDQVFITGNQESLGRWNPNSVKMEKVSDYERSITLDLIYPAEFKFTQGDWNSEGIIRDIDNNPNQILVDSESKDIFVIKGWTNNLSGESLGLDYSIMQFQSKYLGAERQIKIVLPENYDPSKKYPVFYTTDGGGNIFKVAKDYISNFSNDEYRLIPESILVAIVHGMTHGEYNRNKDLDVYYGESGQSFKNFVFKELIPYIDNNYSTSDFNVMIGHSNGAEYNHFLFLEEDNPFRGFISLSTNYYSKDVRKEMGDLFNSYIGKNLYYFVANATVDSPDRIEAGDDYEKIYNSNQNSAIQFKKSTYNANHNSIVPVALSDALRFVFKDYRNFENYDNFISYRDNYLQDLKYNYGIEEQHNIWDMDMILDDIMDNKDKELLDIYLDFVEEEKLWQNSYMSDPGGMDAVNKGNFYFFVEDYAKSAANYRQGLNDLETGVGPRVYFGNLGKGIQAFRNIEDYDGLMELLLGTRDYLNSENELSAKSVKNNLLFINYQIAKLADEQNINKKDGKKAKQYCEDNYKENKYFTQNELNTLL